MRDQLGSSLTVLGDLDLNGVLDVAMGAAADHVRGECWKGSVWIVRLASNGRSLGEVKIRQGESGFTGDLDSDDRFGVQVAGLGDLDLDGIPDLAVSATGDDDLSADAGAVWVLYLESNGNVRAWNKILPPVSGAGIDEVRAFGAGLAHLGDLNGDGKPELAIGANQGDEVGEEGGCVWIASLWPDGSIASHTKISANLGPFGAGALTPGDEFGAGLTSLADIDGNGVRDLAIGAPGDDDTNTNCGALWIVRMRADGTVLNRSKISALFGGGPALVLEDRFGSAVAELGDLDSDGVPDLAVGAPKAGAADGRVWILHMNADRTVKTSRFHLVPSAGPQAELEEQKGFGAALAALGDLDGDGFEDLMAGAPGRGTPITGQVFTHFLRADGTIRSSILHGLSGWKAPAFLYSPSNPEFSGAVARIGDLDGDGGMDLAVGARRESAFADRDGALWILHFDRQRELKSVEKLNRATGFNPGLRTDDQFGASVCVVGDLDDDGFEDLAVGSASDEDGAGGDAYQGSLWILFRGPGGSVVRTQEISRTNGNLGFIPSSEEEFGSAVCALGDLDGDGVEDLAVGAPRRTLVSSSGAVYILFMNTDGTVKSSTRFHSLSGISNFQEFGCALAHLGGRRIAIGERLLLGGRVWIVDLGLDGQPSSFVEIGDASGGFYGRIEDGDRFGSALATLGDLDGDGLRELAVGAPGAHFPFSRGIVWILFLSADGTVRAQRPIRPGDQAIGLPTMDTFGTALANGGDINGDGVEDLLIGNTEDRIFPERCEDGVGVVMTLFLDGVTRR